MKKSILIPVLALALCAALLLAANVFLGAVYRINWQSCHLEDMKTLMPGSEHFVVEPYAGDDANILSVHKGETGYIIETRTYGYAGNITMLVAVSNEGKVVGLVVRNQSETLGLGAKALRDHEFLAQFLNKAGSFAVGTPGADAFSGATGEAATGEEIYVDAITGATVTSKAIARCVNSAVAYVTGADVESGATSWGG